ncbi:SDR family NAD(P)-dependent oxidoreductase [Streptomyces clavifer]|uniref:SDR family NAD(P)-dependent oxidoreductase n=1 Tax=Streptomyces clavifer TaxID=68188 RepID=UPI00381712EC
MASKLTGTVALVTCASSGIGADPARRLTDQGATVALVARRKRAEHEVCNPTRSGLNGFTESLRQEPACTGGWVPCTEGCPGAGRCRHRAELARQRHHPHRDPQSVQRAARAPPLRGHRRRDHLHSDPVPAHGRRRTPGPAHRPARPPHVTPPRRST